MPSFRLALGMERRNGSHFAMLWINQKERNSDEGCLRFQPSAI
jgi:hypothetical protein